MTVLQQASMTINAASLLPSSLKMSEQQHASGSSKTAAVVADLDQAAHVQTLHSVVKVLLT